MNRSKRSLIVFLCVSVNVIGRELSQDLTNGRQPKI